MIRIHTMVYIMYSAAAAVINRVATAATLGVSLAGWLAQRRITTVEAKSGVTALRVE